MATSILENNLNKLAKKLKFGAVTSYAKLWNTSINTFGHHTASMWFFTIQLNDNNQIVGIDIHRTYFNHTPQTTIINKNATFDTPISFEEAFNLLETL